MQIAKIHIRHRIWFVISEKNLLEVREWHQNLNKANKKMYIRISNPSCKPVVFIDMNTYILTQDKSFRTFLKKKYAVALDNCYMFTKGMLNMELNMILIAVMPTDPHQARVNRILKSSPNCKNRCLLTRISTL